jgi:hypothetical protein
LKELVYQRERATWRNLPIHVPTQVLTGDDRPPALRGVTCATIASALAALAAVEASAGTRWTTSKAPSSSSSTAAAAQRGEIRDVGGGNLIVTLN